VKNVTVFDEKAPSHLFFPYSRRQGIASLVINYRGSLGSGEDFVQVLCGRVGFLDVTDCRAVIDAALDKCDELNPGKVALWGGSHGGFLVTHMAS
jgi:acylaminoacyl-peptidase